jgi:glycosyltransferase involved in cell wall biosynthesis
MKVSVVIPVYNAQETIVRALDSVINQTIKPFEIINDGVLISQSLS